MIICSSSNYHQIILTHDIGTTIMTRNFTTSFSLWMSNGRKQIFNIWPYKSRKLLLTSYVSSQSNNVFPFQPRDWIIYAPSGCLQSERPLRNTSPHPSVQRMHVHNFASPLTSPMSSPNEMSQVLGSSLNAHYNLKADRYCPIGLRSRSTVDAIFSRRSRVDGSRGKLAGSIQMMMQAFPK